MRILIIPLLLAAAGAAPARGGQAVSGSGPEVRLAQAFGELSMIPGREQFFTPPAAPEPAFEPEEGQEVAAALYGEEQAGDAPAAQDAGGTIVVSSGSTYFKEDKAAEWSLPASSKCRLAPGEAIRYEGALAYGENHLELTLAAEALPGCPFRKGYIYGPEYAALAQGGDGPAEDGPGAQTDEDQRPVFPDYSPGIGADLAAAIKMPAYCSVARSVVACGPNANSRGCCYSCVAGPDSRYPGAMSRRLPSLGRAIWPVGTAPELNTNSYARSFAEYFIPSIHERATRLRAAYLKGKVNKVGGPDGRYKMPKGSVIVWRSCSGSPAGHIAIVTQPGKQACSDFCGSLDQCPAANIIGMFYPYK